MKFRKADPRLTRGPTRQWEDERTEVATVAEPHNACWYEKACVLDETCTYFKMCSKIERIPF